MTPQPPDSGQSAPEAAPAAAPPPVTPPGAPVTPAAPPGPAVLPPVVFERHENGSEPDWALGNPLAIFGRALGDMLGGWALAWLTFGAPLGVLGALLLLVQFHFSGALSHLVYWLLLGPIALLMENLGLGFFGYLFILVELPLGFFTAMESDGPDRQKYWRILAGLVAVNSLALLIW